MRGPLSSSLNEAIAKTNGKDFQYRRHFLEGVFVIGLLLPVYAFAVSFLKGDVANLWILIGVEATVLALFLLSRCLERRGVEAIIFLILSFYPIGYVWGCFTPGNYGLYVLVLLIMPAVFDSLLPESQYWGWLAYALALVALPLLSGLFGLPSMWTRDFSAREILILHMAFISLWILRKITRNQLLSYADEIAGGIVRDKLTGLSTVVVFNDVFTPGERYLMALVFIGNFRELSTLFGYSITGDLLSSASSRLLAVASDLDGQAFRLRGHDLGFVKRLVGVEQAKDLALALLKGLNGPLVLRGKEVELNYRIGYTLVTDGNAEKALDEAYDALGVAEKGGLYLSGYEPSMNKLREAEFAMEDLLTLSRNLTEGTLSVFFQPVVALSTGKTAWNEALMRFKGLGKELEGPARFMELAATTGHWAAIEDFVFAKAAAMACSGTGPVSINIAPRDLEREDFRDSIEMGIREARGRGSTIILELLEGDFGYLTSDRSSTLRDLRKAGCLIAIDDFGMGYSNYSRLMATPVDIVKFDASLIAHARSSRAETDLLRGIVRFCFDIGALTVAEGVEDLVQAEYAGELGFDFGQGYYWSTPRSEADCLKAERSALLASKQLRFDAEKLM